MDLINKHRQSDNSDLNHRRSVEHLWMDVSMCIETTLINISPIKSHPIEA